MPFLPPADQKAVGNANAWQTHNAVFGDNYMISPTTVANLRLSFLRFGNQSIGATYPADLSKFGPGFAAAESGGRGRLSADQHPELLRQHRRFRRDFAPTTTSYTVAGDVTNTMGRHTVKAGGRPVWSVEPVQWQRPLAS